jgi:hypothetical protein
LSAAIWTCPGASHWLLNEFAGYVRNAGFDVVHVDSFVVLGTTRLRPHIEAMRTTPGGSPPSRLRIVAATSPVDAVV